MLSTSDIFGLAGVLTSLGCYARVQWQRDYAKRLSYSLFNFGGSVLYMFSIWQNWNLAAFISNAAWGVISAYGVYRCIKYSLREQSNSVR